MEIDGLWELVVCFSWKYCVSSLPLKILILYQPENQLKGAKGYFFGLSG